MAQPYIGEIRMFGGNFPPVGWLFCDGQQLPISENEALFQLIGTMYGGDGQETFNLPNLQSRVPMHFGNGFQQTEAAGVEEVTLTVQQIPQHTHPLLASTGSGGAPTPGGNIIADNSSSSVYRPGPAGIAMSNQTVGIVGGSQPHSNLQPYLTITFIISLFGIFPSPT